MALSLNKQKQKEWDNVIKQEAKAKGWEFKGWFAYKGVKDAEGYLPKRSHAKAS